MPANCMTKLVRKVCFAQLCRLKKYKPDFFVFHTEKATFAAQNANRNYE